MSTKNRSNAAYQAVRRLYDRVLRERLPRKLGVLNGVVTRRPRLLDVTDRDPTYKSGLVNPLRDQVTEGDTVINIGGGCGVSTVVAARHVGKSGRVVCYEGGAEYVDLCRETVELNGVADQVEIRHAIVGDDVDVWGIPGEAVSPRELPDCDCLVMDCEGAEWSILKEISQRPDLLAVEAHPQHGVDVGDVWSLLQGWGYETSVEQNQMACDGIEGNRVVTGVRE